MGRTIVKPYLTSDGTLPIFNLTPKVEGAIHDSVRQTDRGTYLAMVDTDNLDTGVKAKLDDTELSDDLPKALQKVDLDLDDAPFLEDEKPPASAPKESAEPAAETARPEGTPPASKKKLLFLIAGLVILLAGGTAAYFLLHKPAAPPPVETSPEPAQEPAPTPPPPPPEPPKPKPEIVMPRPRPSTAARSASTPRKKAPRTAITDSGRTPWSWTPPPERKSMPYGAS